MKNNNNSNVFPLLTGILIGGATIYFLKSEKGKEIVDLALSKSESMKNTIIDNSKDLMESSQIAIDKAIEGSKEGLSVLAEGAKEVAATKLDELDSGIQIAKKKIAKISK